jgi:hypothetical protein
MRIERAENWNRKGRKCEHCAHTILKHDPIIILFTEVTKLPAIYRGIAFHEECAREHLEDLITKI